MCLMKISNAQRFRAHFLKQKGKAAADMIRIEAVVGSLTGDGEGWLPFDEALAAIHRLRDLHAAMPATVSMLLAIERIAPDETYICMFGWESARRGVVASIAGGRLLEALARLSSLREGMIGVYFSHSIGVHISNSDECLVFDDDGSIQLFKAA